MELFSLLRRRLNRRAHSPKAAMLVAAALAAGSGQAAFVSGAEYAVTLRSLPNDPFFVLLDVTAVVGAFDADGRAPLADCGMTLKSAAGLEIKHFDCDPFPDSYALEDEIVLRNVGPRIFWNDLSVSMSGSGESSADIYWDEPGASVRVFFSGPSATRVSVPGTAFLLGLALLLLMPVSRRAQGRQRAAPTGVSLSQAG